ncbi:MAG: nucleotidyltransferase domain-containing protein [Acidobacteriota bacterium]
MQSLALPPGVAAALEELKRALREIYGPRLRGVYLYGSYARNEAGQESDVDILIELDGRVQTGIEISRINTVVSSICLKNDLLISTFPISAESLENQRSPFLTCVRREAVRL